MNFFKHVGQANGKKVVIVARQLPGEEHMAGVIYSEILPSRFHDDLMKVLESDIGQQANEFREALQRSVFSNGDNMLESLHSEGYIKKVAANAVIVKPNSKSAIRLDELNKLLSDIRSGRAAQQELEEVVVVAPAPVAAPAAVAVESDDRIAKLEAMIMGLAQQVQTLATPAKASKSKKSA